MKAVAPMIAEKAPITMSTSGSVAHRESSEMRYSGLSGSVWVAAS